MREYKTGGLKEKYIISKINKPVDKKAVYFPLRLDADLNAQIAAIEYAKSVMIENPSLASDLLYLVACIIDGVPGDKAREIVINSRKNKDPLRKEEG